MVTRRAPSHSRPGRCAPHPSTTITPAPGPLDLPHIVAAVRIGDQHLRGAGSRRCATAASRARRSAAGTSVTTGRENCAPMPARMALGPYGSAVPGEHTTAGQPEGHGAPHEGAHVAGSPTPSR